MISNFYRLELDGIQKFSNSPRKFFFSERWQKRGWRTIKQNSFFFSNKKLRFDSFTKFSLMRSLSREDSPRITHWVMNENYKQALKVSTVLFNLCRYWLFSFKKSAFVKRQIFKIWRLYFFCFWFMSDTVDHIKIYYSDKVFSKCKLCFLKTLFYGVSVLCFVSFPNLL